MWKWLMNLLGIKPSYAPPVLVPAPIPKYQPPNVRDKTMSAMGFEMTKYYEGLYLESYRDSGGTWTIGYGRIFYDNGKPVGEGETCTKEQAEAWLLEDMEKDGAHYVRAWTKDLSQNQFDALADFGFNAGAGTLEKLLKASGELADNIVFHDPNKLLGRRRRRLSNRAMFLGFDWTIAKGWKPE